MRTQLKQPLAKIVTALTVAVWLTCGAGAAADGDQLRGPPAAGGGRIPVHLYFAAANGLYLMSEARAIGPSDDPVKTAEAIMAALIAGPRTGLIRTLPIDTRVRSLFITSDGVCAVDFEKTVRDLHPGGCRNEWLTVFAVVNSLLVNIPSVARVKILIDGNEADTLAGHVDLKAPLPANMLIIR